MARAGQAMIETVIAVLIISSLFFGLFWLSRLLTVKMLCEHAAMRVARARAVGLNEFMCLKAARICVIPVAGERTRPDKGDPRSSEIDEVALAKIYLCTPDMSHADGLLQYEKWNDFYITPGHGGASHAYFNYEGVRLEGEAEVDDWPTYLQ